MRYTYLGNKLTEPALVNLQCDPVKRPDGKCIVSVKMATALVIDSSGNKYVVLRRKLRLNKKGEAKMSEDNLGTKINPQSAYHQCAYCTKPLTQEAVCKSKLDDSKTFCSAACANRWDDEVEGAMWKPVEVKSMWDGVPGQTAALQRRIEALEAEKQALRTAIEVFMDNIPDWKPNTQGSFIVYASWVNELAEALKSEEG